MKDTLAYKHRYSLKEYYKILLPIIPAARILKRNRREQIVSEQMIERLMLAVTEVNDCALCSYAHTNMALDMGLAQEEIESLLSGSDLFVQPEEATAILFVQGYAEDHGVLTIERYHNLIGTYGKEKSEVILAAAQGMMVGNIIGLPLSALTSRFKGKKYSNSSLFYEIFMPLSLLILLPLTLLHRLAMVLGIMEKPLAP